MTELATLATNQGPTVVVVAIFIWFLTVQGKANQKVQEDFNRTIKEYLSDANKVQAELAVRLAEVKEALAKMYSHSWNLVKENKKQASIIKEYECEEGKRVASKKIGKS